MPSEQLYFTVRKRIDQHRIALHLRHSASRTPICRLGSDALTNSEPAVTIRGKVVP
jgi:hypothetical protein